MKGFIKSKKKIILVAIVVLAIIAMIIPKSTIVSKLKNLQRQEAKAYNSQFELEASYEDAADESVVDSNGNVIANLYINSYFLDDEGQKRRGACKDIAVNLNENPDASNVRLYVDVNLSQDNVRVEDTEIRVYHDNAIMIPTLSEGGQIEKMYADDHISLEDIVPGNAVHIPFDMKNNVWWNGQEYRNHFTNIGKVVVSGKYVDADNNVRSFEKEMKYQLDWLAETKINSLTFTNQVYGDQFMKLSDNRLVGYYKVVSGNEENQAITAAGEYKMTGFKVNGIAPEIIVTADTGAYWKWEAQDVNYDEATDTLTWRCVRLNAGEGRFNNEMLYSNITVIYPKTLYDNYLANQTNEVKTTLNVECKNMYYTNPNIVHTEPSLLTGQIPELGTVYTQKREASLNVDFNNYAGELFFYRTYVSSQCKVNSEVKYYGADVPAGYVEDCHLTVNAGGGLVTGTKIEWTNDDPAVHSFMDDLGNVYSMEGISSYSGIEIPSGTFDLLGENGWVKVYDANTNALIGTYTEAGIYNYSNNYKKIRIETSAVESPGKLTFNNHLKIDNDELIKKYPSIQQFNNFTIIAISSNGYIKVRGDSNWSEPYGWKDRGPYITGKLQLQAGGELAADTYESTVIPYEATILTTKYNEKDSQNAVSYFNNPKLLIELPVIVSNANVVKNSLRVYTEEGDLPATISKTKKNGKVCFIVSIQGETTEKINIKADFDITPNTKKVKESTEAADKQIRTFANTTYDGSTIIGNIQKAWWNVDTQDIYDWNGINGTTDNYHCAIKNLIFTEPIGIRTTTSLQLEGTEGEVMCPDNLELIKPNDEGKTVTVKNALYNYSDGIIKNLKLVSRIPYEGNYFLKSGDNMGSEFTTVMTSGISLPAELRGVATVKYSTQDVTIVDNVSVNDINDSRYGWTTNPSDWSQIKSYMIDFGDRIIERGETFDFKYNIKLPDSLDYGTYSYTSDAIVFNAEEEGHDIFQSVESTKVGLAVVSPVTINVNFTKVDADDNNIQLNGAKYKLSRVDGRKILQEDGLHDYIELGSDTTSKFTINNLYPETEYKLEEIQAPGNYKTQDVIFKLSDDGTGYKFVVTEGSLSGEHTLSFGNDWRTIDVNIEDEKADINYKVEYYYENESGNYEQKATRPSETRSAKANEEVTVTDDDKDPKVANYVLSSHNEEERTGTVAEDGSTTLKVYFDLDEAGYKVEFYYMDDNGEYPTNPYASIDRSATNGSQVTLSTPTRTNDYTVKVTDSKVENEDISRPKTDKNYVYDADAANITSATVNGDGSTVLKVHFKHIPVNYNVDAVLKNTADTTLTSNQFTITRTESDSNPILLWNKSAVSDGVELNEKNLKTSDYEYRIEENRSSNEKYVNVLEGKYVSVNVKIGDDGKPSVTSWTIKYDNGTQVASDDSVYSYVEAPEIKIIDGVETVFVKIINPVKFVVELDKYDTTEEPLVGATFEIESPIIKEQAYEHDNRIISGIKEGGIAEDGTVTGTTENDIERSPDGTLLRARVSYEETWVDANETEDDYYTYVIKETKTPGAQYVNVLDGYQVVLKVHVDAEGNLTLKEVNGRNYEIVATGDKEVTDELYRYVSVNVSNNKILATLNTEVINPVRYKVAVHETIYGNEQIPLKDIPVEIESEFSGSTTIVTDENGYNEMEEWVVWAGTYEYRVFQLNEFMGNVVEDEFVNMFDGYYIGIDLYVPADGDIKTISDNGDYTTVSYKIFKKEEDGSFSQVNFNDTILDDFVKVKVDKAEDNVCTLNIYLVTPEKYDFRLVKTDVDTMLNMNNVQFSVTSRDANGEVELKEVDSSVKDKFNTINTKDKLTDIVDGVDGVISFKDILIERAGTYTFELKEVTPIVDGIIYKEKSENILVQADIVVRNGKYVLNNMQVLQADRYTIPENTNLKGNETQTVDVNVMNERIKGSYDLALNKFNKFTGLPLDGAVYKITVEQEGKENKVLYVSDGKVLSKNIAIPHIEEESLSVNGVTKISNIGIEIPETYTIKIEEIKAPNTFIKLDDIIELEVTTGIEGEYDDAHYVLKEIKLKDGNHGLVSETHSMSGDEKQNININININNEYFDLALRQYITDVNGTEITTRAPSVNVDKLQSAEATTADYTQVKDLQRAYAGQEVIYTIDVYNEGMIDGYAEEIVEHLPEGLEYVDDEFNSKYGWSYDKENHEVVTNILARAVSEDNVINAYDKDTQTLNSKKIQLKLRVKEDVKLKTILTTIAEIRKSLVKDKNETVDRDSYELVSLPVGDSLAQYAEWQEDDDDFEKLVIEEFDLATVKYVKSVNGNVQENRKPELTLDQERSNEYAEGIFNGFKYKKDNELPKVKQNDTLVYGIEVYNEGSVGAYATEVRDTIPNGLIFVKDSEINKKYGWRMLDLNGNETTDVTKAAYVVTDYLSKEKETEENGNLIKAMDIADGNITIDNKALEVEFVVADTEMDSRIIENVADVTKYSDEQGTKPIDRDPEERLKENRERVYIMVFDLELEQVISKVELTNKSTGEVTVVNPDETGKLAKIDIEKSKLVNMDIKVEYTIKVKNNGETAGYATEIVDYIPDGFTFKAEDNDNWSEVDGHIVSRGLADTLIKPGETKEVKLVLRWNGSAMNIGRKTNTSEIADDKDEYKKDVKDIDSTPNNLDLSEDDIDATNIIITVKTGSAEIAILIAILVLMVATSLGIAKYYSSRKN